MNCSRVTAIALAAFAVLAGSAQARLGETPEDLEYRFGEPIRHTSYHLEHEIIESCAYYRTGWVIVVSYWNGYSAHEQYFRIANSLPRNWVREWFSFPDSFWEPRSTPNFLYNLGRHSEGLSNKEIRTILQANADGHGWRQRSRNVLYFVRDDGRAEGRYLHRDDDGESLLLVTSDFQRRLDGTLGSGNPVERTRTRRVLSF
jgi:hypothetical protein